MTKLLDVLMKVVGYNKKPCKPRRYNRSFAGIDKSKQIIGMRAELDALAEKYKEDYLTFAVYDQMSVMQYIAGPTVKHVDCKEYFI